VWSLYDVENSNELISISRGRFGSWKRLFHEITMCDFVFEKPIGRFSPDPRMHLYRRGKSRLFWISLFRPSVVWSRGGKAMEYKKFSPRDIVLQI